jgi:hypothetical protein
MSDDPKNGQPPRPLLVIPASSGQLPTSPEEETKMPCPVCAVGMVSPTQQVPAGEPAPSVVGG